jgi:hypothetical protein
MTKLGIAALMTCASAIALGCDSGEDGDGAKHNDGSAAHVDRDAGDAAQEANADAGACSGCAASEGCVQIDVSVKADSADLPWKLWPDKTSGSGRLFAGVVAAGAAVRVRSEDGVNLTTLTGNKSIDVCSPAGSVNAFCFLDDASDGMLQNPAESPRGSTNYLDTCSAQRQIAAAVTVGSRTSVACSLSVSCD